MFRIPLALLIFWVIPCHAATTGTEHAIPNEDTKDATLLNLGPLGFRIKTELDKQGQGIGRSGQVAYIFKNSQAEVKLEIGDKITSIGGKPITEDIGKFFGQAIDLAEGSDGKIMIGFDRGSEKKEATFQLESIGSFSKNFPYDCPKSSRLITQACDWLATCQRASGRWEPDGDGYITVSSYATLALLSSGDPKYAPNIHAAVDALLNTNLDPSSDTLIGWKYNNLAWLLSEYYLQTRDPAIPPKLIALNKALRGIQLEQMKFPYWFAHSDFKKETVGPDDGYVYLGIQVANTLVSWSLMRECGVAVDEKHLAETWAAVEKAGPSGEMPYAPRPKQPGGDGDAWGRTGVSAVASKLWGKDPHFARAIADSLERQLPTNFFNSHGTSVMGKPWGALGCAASDPKLYRKLMVEYKASFDLMRLADGRFVPQPAGTHTTDFGGGFTQAHIWTTACNTLIFAPARKQLRIAGGDFAMLGIDPGKLSGILREAYDSIAQGKGKTVETFLKKVPTYPRATAEDRRVAELMSTFISRSVKPTISN